MCYTCRQNYAKNLVLLLWWEGFNLNSQVNNFVALNLPSAKLNKFYFTFYLESKDGKAIDKNVKSTSRDSEGQFKHLTPKRWCSKSHFSSIYQEIEQHFVSFFLPLNNTNVQHNQSTKQDDIEGLKYGGWNWKESRWTFKLRCKHSESREQSIITVSPYTVVYKKRCR